MRVRQLRMARGWSQAQLAELSGLSIRTIQRVENGTHPGLESLRSLAAVFGVEISELADPGTDPLRAPSFRESVVASLRRYDDFTGTTGRTEFWWSALAVLLVLALAAAIGPQVQVAVTVVLLLPMASLGARRLRDAGQNPWWLLIVFAPVGGIIILAWLWSMPTTAVPEATEAAEPS